MEPVIMADIWGHPEYPFHERKHKNTHTSRASRINITMDDPYYVPVYDVTGHKIKRYRQRKHPLEDWTEEEFRRRYRITKPVAIELIHDFAQWYPKDPTRVGGKIRLDDRVSIVHH